jgi:thiopurine S-methyltransferase
MDPQFWVNRWTENRIGFHVKGANPLLKQYWPASLTAGRVPAGRIVVPLCGKSEDLRWLSEQGHDVVGVELSEIAAKAFFTEQGIECTVTSEPPFTVFRGKGITIYVGDFLKFTTSVAGEFDYFYDRAAVIALPPSMRPAYARQLASVLTPKSSGLLISLSYEPSESDGPPFSVPEKEVHVLFSGFEIQKLDEKDILEDEQRFKDRGVRSLLETVYRLSHS